MDQHTRNRAFSNVRSLMYIHLLLSYADKFSAMNYLYTVNLQTESVIISGN